VEAVSFTFLHTDLLVMLVAESQTFLGSNPPFFCSKALSQLNLPALEPRH
jgi:hypothetical protein